MKNMLYILLTLFVSSSAFAMEQSLVGQAVKKRAEQSSSVKKKNPFSLKTQAARMLKVVTNQEELEKLNLPQELQEFVQAMPVSLDEKGYMQAKEKNNADFMKEWEACKGYIPVLYCNEKNFNIGKIDKSLSF